MKILAMDLSSYGQTTVCCLYDTAERTQSYQRVQTTREAILAHAQRTEPDEIVFEACGVSHILYRVLEGGPWKVVVASVNEEPWKWRAVKRKTDRDDALKIAKLAAAGDIVPVFMPDDGSHQWRLLIHYRDRLVKRRSSIRHQIRSLLDREGILWAKGWQGWTPQALLDLEALSTDGDPLESEQAWRCHLACELAQHRFLEQQIGIIEKRLARFSKDNTAVALLRTIPGVGPRCAEAIASYIVDPKRFRSGKQVANSVGLTPRIYQSGDMERITRISKRGNPLVRTLLVEVCWLGRQVNPWMASVFEHHCAGTAARRKIAIVACARRLIIRMWAMLRDGLPWNPDGLLASEGASPSAP